MRSYFSLKILAVLLWTLVAGIQTVSAADPVKYSVIFTSTPAQNTDDVLLDLNKVATIDEAGFPNLNTATDRITNRVALILEEQPKNGDQQSYLPDAFTATVGVKIIYTPKNGSEVTVYKDLEITYDPNANTTYNPRQYFTFRNAGRVSVTITSLPADVSLLPLLKVTNEMYISNDYTFNCSVPAAPVIGDWGTGDDIVTVTTVQDAGPEIANQVDLEWAWISDVAEQSGKYNNNGSISDQKVFEENATRVTLDIGNSIYQVPVIFDEAGHLFVRQRYVMQYENGARLEGPWSASSAKTDPNPDGYLSTHNWQVTTSFAENGTKKTVISYYDGTLRERQTVTRDNSIPGPDGEAGGKTIVAETKYDYQGRPVINILPAPTLNNLLRYTRNFNVFSNDANVADLKELYDVVQNSCDAGAPALNSVPESGVSGGSSNYYSPDNLLYTGSYSGQMKPYDRFIPDAHGYPYSQTVFDDINVGEVSIQGGVGEAHQPGTGHATRYYYGQPDQKDLNILFGKDAGNASHYFKNMVRDANGQYNISYIDMYGRTVATALAGTEPTSLTPLKSKSDLKSAWDAVNATFTKNLLNSNVVKDRYIESVSSVQIPEASGTKPSVLTFNYSIDPSQVLNLNTCNNQSAVCYDCTYNLEITVEGSCNNAGLPGAVQFRFPLQENITQGDLNCNTASSGNQYTFGPLSITAPGEYIVTKRLILSKTAQDSYRDNYMDLMSNSDCEQSFITQYQSSITGPQTNECKPTCETCMAGFGSLTQYLEGRRQQMNLATLTDQQTETLTQSYNDQLAACQQLCNATAPTLANTNPDELQALRNMMLDDMTPAKGQYARIDFIDHEAESAEDQDKSNDEATLETEIANLDNPASGRSMNKVDFTTRPFNIFNKEEGLKYKTVAPTQTTGEFVNTFDANVAEKLLPFHPEWPALDFAEKNLTETYRFAALLKGIDKFSDANTNDWILNLIDHDPFYKLAGGGSADGPGAAAYRETMTVVYNSFVSGGSRHASMWEVAIAMGMCKTYSTGTLPVCQDVMPDIGELITNTSCSEDRDQAWIHFRNLYLSVRAKHIYELLESQIPAKNRNAINDPANFYQARFINPDVHQAVAGLPGTESGTENEAESEVESALGQVYDKNIEAYEAVWRVQLRKCAALNSHSTIFESLINTLKAICKAGSDKQHPFGSSTQSSDPGLPASFSDAIAAALNNAGVSTFDGDCNPYSIDMPLPHDQAAYNNLVITSRPAECQCVKLRALYDQYGGDETGSGLSSALASMGIVDADGNAIDQTKLDAVLSLCNGTTACKNLAEPIVLPPAFDCNVNLEAYCISCTEYQTQSAAFYPLNSGRTGVPYSSPDPDATDDAGSGTISFEKQLVQNELFAGFMNAKTGFHKTWMEYLEFEQQCGGGSTGCPSCRPSGNNLSLQAGNLLLCNSPVSEADPVNQPTDCQRETDFASDIINESYQSHLQWLKDDFDSKYRNKCLFVAPMERFTVTISTPLLEYHYTLYYYDQAGNLVQTVSPQGVDTWRDYYVHHILAGNLIAAMNDLNSKVEAGTADPINYPFATRYLYNSLNQVVQQKTPDAGASEFWYDYLGRLVVSRNAKQKEASPSKFSYTMYDYLGRITEVGEKQTNSQVTQSMTQDPAINSPLDNWLQTGTDRQITQTVYDQPSPNGLDQENLRNRVSYSMVIPDNNSSYSFASFYSYDIHGNVKLLIQDYGIASDPSNRIKQIRYDYDLVSGKVNKVSYQENKADAFYHRYSYDAENRLTRVETSRDNLDWFSDARYMYYRHGPLARTEIGDLRVQGVDYAYTLQGWLKMINPSYSAATVGSCALGTAPTDLRITNRTSQIPQVINGVQLYEAGNSITFDEGFESYDNDNYVAQLKTKAVACNTSANASEVYDEDGTSQKSFARDAYRVNLNYFEGDFNPAHTATANVLNSSSGIAAPDRHDLFNGNISSMAVNIRKLAMNAITAGASYAGPMVYNYRYDQLNRIIGMSALPADANFNLLPNVNTQDYREDYSYDANGNILGLARNGTSGAYRGNLTPQLAMDNLAYKYYYKNNNAYQAFSFADAASIPDISDPGIELTNRLAIVRDNVTNAAAYTEDVDDPGSDPGRQLSYDAIGNIVADPTNGISNITWNVYGKIETIRKSDIEIRYTYDAAGNRVSKSVYHVIGSVLSLPVTTWYVRDAQGNTLSTYVQGDPAVNNSNFTQTEIDLYGSARLGVMNTNVDCSNLALPEITNFTRGVKLFELTNHLGNVLSTVTDRLDPIPTAAGNIVDYYQADVLSASDYYPGGMQMPGRTYSSGSYRYGFNGQEKSDEIKGSGNSYTAMFWEYDPRLGRRWNVDPKINPNLSPYATFGNNPILLIDPLGDKEYKNYEGYKKALGKKAIAEKDWKGQDGNWLEGDRESWERSHSSEFSKGNRELSLVDEIAAARFNGANEFNIKQKNGSDNYENLEQRKAFYNWFQSATNNKGFETRWSGGAAQAVNKLEFLVDGWGKASGLFGYTNAEIGSWVKAGNKLILDDVWSSLMKLYSGPVLKGKDAYNWDAAQLLVEQQVIDPSYWNLSIKSLSILENSLKKNYFLSKIMTAASPTFKGTLLSVNDRWVYGMTLMNYRVTAADVPIPVECPESPQQSKNSPNR